jgi:hypothetical protein
MPLSAETHFYRILKDGVPIKINKNISGLMAIKELLIYTTFDPP